MPSIWSKILMPEWSFPYNCYEVGHTWTPSCTEAALEIGFIVLREAIKLYTPLYFLTQGLQKKYDFEAFKQTFHSIARSSLFLSFNAFSVILIFCLSRKVVGKFYYSLCAYTPAFLGSLMAIHIERPSRRSALAVYVTNLATETLFRIFVARGYFKPIPKGEVLLFTISISILLYLIKKNGYGNDPVSSALKFIVGREEAKKRLCKSPITSITPTTTNNGLVENGNHNGLIQNKNHNELIQNKNHNELIQNRKHNELIQNRNHNELIKNGSSNNSTSISKLYSKTTTKSTSKYFLLNLYEKLNSTFPKHTSCTHNGKSCPIYIFHAFVRPFFIGWFVKSLIQTFSKPKLFFNRPSLLQTNLLKRRHVYFGLFLGAFTSIYKGVNCALRWACNESHDWHGFVGGLFAGPAMFFSPSSSITLYLMWKCIETLYCIGAKKGVIPFVKPTVYLLYAMSTAQLFYAAVLEPKHMKPSYMKFLDRMTDHRLHLLNRMILDVFGTDASAGYESYFPDLDLKYMTKRFQESVFMWLL